MCYGFHVICCGCQFCCAAWQTILTLCFLAFCFMYSFFLFFWRGRSLAPLQVRKSCQVSWTKARTPGSCGRWAHAHIFHQNTFKQHYSPHQTLDDVQHHIHWPLFIKHAKEVQKHNEKTSDCTLRPSRFDASAHNFCSGCLSCSLVVLRNLPVNGRTPKIWCTNAW